MKKLVRLTCLLALLIGGLAAPGNALASASPAPAASASYACPEWSATADILSNYGTRWGYVHLVNSSGCNHWGSVALHDPVPSGYQVNVTLTRYSNLTGDEADHRYCYVNTGGTNCHTEAIQTTDCAWQYKSSAVIYRWDGKWVPMAWGSTGKWFAC
jgi:hypothetical protein